MDTHQEPEEDPPFGPPRISMTAPNNVWTPEQFTEIVARLLDNVPAMPEGAFQNQGSLSVMRCVVLRSLLHQAVPAGNS